MALFWQLEPMGCVAQRTNLQAVHPTLNLQAADAMPWFECRSSQANALGLGSKHQGPSKHALFPFGG